MVLYKNHAIHIADFNSNFRWSTLDAAIFTTTTRIEGANEHLKEKFDLLPPDSSVWLLRDILSFGCTVCPMRERQTLYTEDVDIRPYGLQKWRFQSFEGRCRINLRTVLMFTVNGQEIPEDNFCNL